MRHLSPTFGLLCALALLIPLFGCGKPAVKAKKEELPKEFTDTLVEAPVEKDCEIEKEGKMVKMHQSLRGIKAPFKMILVPGDPAKNIAPFYIGETEVTWELLKPWSHWEDVTAIEGSDKTYKNLRPSNIATECDLTHMMGYEGTPAMGMTRLNAEKFCLYLSQKTGRTYRLPTEAEWDLAYQLGGGDPKTQDGKLAAAWCKDNSDDTLDENLENADKIYAHRVGKVKTRAPNTLGLYDMLGNVAEWVKTPGAADVNGKNTFVRGGDFTTPVAELSGYRREESDNRHGLETKESWNWSYPQAPNSRWWYKDHFQVGFRLVCEPVNLPKP